MSGIEILLSGARGIYIPQSFAEGFLPHYWGFAADDEDIATLREGPEAEWYWDAWNNVLARAEHTDSAGNVWLLSQDDDLFAYCEALMTYDEKVDFFGWAEDEGDGQPTEAEEWASFDEGC